MTRVLLFGTGSVGSIYAYILQNGGAHVTAVCRSNFSVVKSYGIHIASEIFGDVHATPNVIRSASDASNSWDYVVICCKASTGVSPTTSELIEDAIGPSTAIVLAQNGIGIEEEYTHAFPQNTIISGVVYIESEETSPGHISMSGAVERLEIGTYPRSASNASNDKLKEFAKLFEIGGATCEIFDDIQVRRWSKLMVNASWNPILALTYLSDADFLRSSLDDGAAEKAVRDVMLEVVAIAQAKGYHDLTKETVENQIARPRSRLDKDGKEPSMLADVRHGRTMEVEPILGNVMRIAREEKIETPRLDMLYVLAKARNHAMAIGTGPKS